MIAGLILGRAEQIEFLGRLMEHLPFGVFRGSATDYLDRAGAPRVFRLIDTDGAEVGGGTLLKVPPDKVGCQYFALFPNGAGRLLYAIKAVAELVFSDPAASRFAFTHLPSDTVTPRVCEILGTKRLGPYLHYIDRGQP